ncbi:phosphoribosyltransferase [Pedobacter sp. ISL-68]|uniref:phosphoribosyltransferase n=1 Tax=unclassified Pedobacter TaxID=2628915 RepID=UPI001BEA3D25|nr:MULTISPECIES: phosphoribosyltransferase [unclassified Pedobacter]MBT2563034.1 phosphoribosyltransferase [Pedobacter sp. ISL-64]MBT2593038.1 phosphoribosyltransferase [Pedobacter sp. ISL-68]
MNSFKIYPNNYLGQEIQAFYHSDYHGGDAELRNIAGTIENIICTLKNQFQDKTKEALTKAGNNLIQILNGDFLQILQITGKNNLTVCVIPRAKAQKNYTSTQLVFKKAVTITATNLNSFIDGTNYIIRHTDTRTTHMDRSGYGGDGELPYPGITKDTCTISDNVKGKDILLVDDLYTKTVNIDEDALQALLDKGANSVLFYALGKTKSRSID